MAATGAMAMAFEKNRAYQNLRIHRLEGSPKITRDYYIVADDKVRAFTIPADQRFTNRSRPVGISCFIPIQPPDNHGSVEGAGVCFILMSVLPQNWGLVYTHEMTLQSATHGQTKAYHFNLFPTVPLNEETFLSVVTTDIVTGIPEWGLCTHFEAGGLAKMVLKDSDLDDFDDTRVRTLAYYAAMWYADGNADNVDKCHLSDLYFWLVEQKPSLELVFEDVRCSSVMYFLNTFGAENGDFMGAADLQDVKLELEKMVSDLDLLEARGAKERFPYLIRGKMLSGLSSCDLIAFGEPWMKSISAELGYAGTVFAGQLVDKSIDAVLFVPDGAHLKRPLPFVLDTPGCPQLLIESCESRPSLGSDDTDDTEIAKPFYENLLECFTEHFTEVSMVQPPAHAVSVPEEDRQDVVSDSVLNIEVHIPKFVVLSREIVKCSGVTKTGMPCGNRRRLAVGQLQVFCHHHLDQAPESSSRCSN